MTHFILMDAGIGNFVFLIVGPVLIGFILGAIYLIIRSIRVIHRELKNEKENENGENSQS